MGERSRQADVRWHWFGCGGRSVLTEDELKADRWTAKALATPTPFVQ